MKLAWRKAKLLGKSAGKIVGVCVTDGISYFGNVHAVCLEQDFALLQEDVLRVKVDKVLPI